MSEDNVDTNKVIAEIITTAGIEGLKLLVLGIIQAMKQAGKTEEEIDDMFDSAWLEFQARPASELLKVGE